MWLILQNCAFLFDESNVSTKDIHTFYKSLSILLPCPYCQNSYKDYLQEIPLPNENFAPWVFQVHNRVNKKLNLQHIQTFTENTLPKEPWLQKKYQKVLSLFESKGLFKSPQYEVVRKRYYFNIDDPLPMRDLLTVFIALLMKHGPIPEVFFFAEIIHKLVPIPKILRALQSKMPLESIKELKFSKEHMRYANVMRAGINVNDI